MNEIAIVVDAQYDGDYRIRITFNDGSRNTIDFRKWLDGPMFEALQDVRYFQRIVVSGGTISWPNGADIAPETLYGAQGRTDTGRRTETTQRSG